MNNQVHSFICASAVTEFSLVSIDSNGKVAITTAATDIACVGVAQRAASAGEAVDVVTSGETKVIAGEAIADFSATPRLAATTAGKVQKAEASDSGFFPTCFALPNVNQASAAANDQIRVEFRRPCTPLA